MSDPRGFDPQGFDPRAEPSLDAIRRSDGFIDALASGRPVAPQDAVDADLAALLGGWRDESRFPPSTGLISEADAIAALNAGRAQSPVSSSREKWTATPTRSRRGLSVVGAAAAAVMAIGGFGAVVAGAGPGDALYGLRSMLFGAPKEVRDDQVALAARTEMNQVQDLIARGDWAQAQDRLVAVSTQVATIEDGQQKQELLTQFNDLSAKVVERDPAATAPPGIIYTVPPLATDLVPAVAPPTSTPSVPPTDSATSTPESATPTSATPTSATPTSATSGTPTSAPTTSAPTTSTSGTTATSAAPATTTATSAAPVTTTTTAAPAATTATTAAPAATTATTAAPAATTATSAAPAATTATSAAPAATTATSAAPAATTATSAAPAATTATSAAPATTTTAAQRAATTTAASAAAPATQAETAQAETAQAETAQAETAQAETAQAETPADTPAEVAIEEAPVIATTTEAVAPLPVPAG